MSSHAATIRGLVLQYTAQRPAAVALVGHLFSEFSSPAGIEGAQRYSHTLAVCQRQLHTAGNAAQHASARFRHGAVLGAAAERTLFRRTGSAAQAIAWNVGVTRSYTSASLGTKSTSNATTWERPFSAHRIQRRAMSDADRLDKYRKRMMKEEKAVQPPADSPKTPQSDNSTSEPRPSEASKSTQYDSEPAKTVAAAAGVPKHLLDRLPHLSHLHRPTKDELLAAATSFWQRLGIRFKWFSIRSFRPFNTDEIGAFISWIFLGHIIWLIVGTTTFVSLAILAVNTVFAQETLAGWVGNYLTASSGVKVVFESAVVPRWKDGVITFKNVFVSRRPGQKRGAVSKGSANDAAAAAMAENLRQHDGIEEDTNYTQFDVSISTVNVTLSFTKWFNGKGLLRDVEVKGVRGVVDRTSVRSTGEYVDPKSYRHSHNTGDFEIDAFKMDDVLVTVYQPRNFRPFTISVYTCELPRLRKQWLFYDFLSANMMSGSFDDSLFTIHPRQTHSLTGESLGPDGSEGWKKHSRLRIDGLKIDHLNRGVEGPFSWIQEGNVDIVADVMFPADEDGSIAKVMSDFYDRMEATVTNAHIHSTHQHDASDAHEAHDPSSDKARENDSRFLVLDLRVHLNSVHASVPLFTRDLSYVNNALVRPIVAYINSKNAFIPINCRVVKRASEFDGSWTIFDSGLLDDLSREVYEAFSRDVTDERARVRRIKKVGLWTLQVAAQALFIGLAGQLA